MSDREWSGRARCRPGNPEGIDPELFFPVGHTGPALVQVEQARAVCAGCPVRAECLAAAFELQALDARRRVVVGVWGGTTEDERADMVRAVRA